MESQRVSQEDRDGLGLALPSLRLDVDGKPSPSAAFPAQSVSLDRKDSEGTQSDPDSLFDTESNEPESATTESYHPGQDIKQEDSTHIKRRDSEYTERSIERTGDSRELIQAPWDEVKAVHHVFPEVSASFDDVDRDETNILHQELDSSDGNAFQDTFTADHESVEVDWGETLIGEHSSINNLVVFPGSHLSITYTVHTSADIVEADEGTRQDCGFTRGNGMNLENQKEDHRDTPFRIGHPHAKDKSCSSEKVVRAEQLVERSPEMELRIAEARRGDGCVLASRNAETVEGPNVVLFPVKIAPPIIEAPSRPEEATFKPNTQALAYQKPTFNASQANITGKEGGLSGGINKQKSRLRLGLKRSIIFAPETKPAVVCNLPMLERKDLDIVLGRLEQRLERGNDYLQVFLRFGLALSEVLFSCSFRPLYSNRLYSYIR